MERFIDLHTHSIHSDGQYSVCEILSFAQKEGLSLFSLTDHNTVGGYKAIKRARDLFKGEIIPGVEITTMYKGEIVEILGYGIDLPTMERLQKEYILTFREKQMREKDINLAAFLAHGAKMSDEFVYAMKNDPVSIFDPDRETSRKYYYKEIVSHKENAKFFGGEENMKALSFGGFSRKYVYKPGSPLYVDQRELYPTFEKTVEIIKEAGGKALLAHLFLYSEDVLSDLDEIALNKGLDGLESHYKKFTKENVEFIDSYCKKHGLIISGGSDFHGERVSPGRKIGKTVCDEPFSEGYVENWTKDVLKI